MTKTWPNVNPRFGPKPVQTNFEAHAVAATAFVVMTYTHKARVKEAEQSGKYSREKVHSFHHKMLSDSSLASIDA